MAIQTNTTNVASIATALNMQANAVAHTKMKSIQNVADILAAMMQDIHGGDWRAACDHECGFIVIRPLKDKPIQKPKRGEVA